MNDLLVIDLLVGGELVAHDQVLVLSRSVAATGQRETKLSGIGYEMMATPKKLKVFRTPIGFHDAYVAAPTQKAALEAWGSKHNLFARGMVETITDAALIKEPLAHPGTVIKRSRGTTAEQIAALPAEKSGRSTDARGKAVTSKPAPATTRKVKSVPKPTHVDVDQAEASLAHLEDTHEEASRTLAAEQAELDRRRAALKADQQSEIADARRALDSAEDKYAAAMKRWRG